MQIISTLLYGAAHGHPIGKHIQRTTNDFLSKGAGALSSSAPAGEEGMGHLEMENGRNRNREFKYYRLTNKNGKHLTVEESAAETDHTSRCPRAVARKQGDLR